MKTPQEFIEHFSAIPEEKWTRFITLKNLKGQCCALGHCPVGSRLALTELFHAQDLTLTGINDSPLFKFNQPTPKQRVLAALEVIAQKQQQP